MKILVFPKAEDNPYQELLYKEFCLKGDKVHYIYESTSSASINNIILIPQLIYLRIRGYKIFHLHWIYSFVSVYSYYLFILWLIKALGYKLVWTAHNVVPHEKKFHDDVVARQKLVAKADLVISHSMITIDGLKEINAAPKKFVIIPHPSYVGVYPNIISREEARKKLHINLGTFVYLYLGNIRYYKGVDELLDAYKTIENENNFLIIAGACNDNRLREKLISYTTQSSHILWQDGVIDDANLQYYFNAADVAVLPFKKVSTSGSAILALSFGKAVIVPTIGDLKDLPDTISYKYVPPLLPIKMEEVKNNVIELNAKGIAAMNYAKLLTWSDAANTTRNAMLTLFL
jgi:glycosyltransferase involved in cell wall biosynthesis